MNHYQVLGIGEAASANDIKLAYRKLSLKFHPDKNPGDAYFEEWTKKVNDAYDTLGNPLKKAAYDQYLAEERARQDSLAGYGDDEELYLLRDIRDSLPAYYEAWNRLFELQEKYRKLSDKNYPLVITWQKATACIAGIIAALAGLWYSLMK